jgi:chromosome segregation ATPase
MKTISKALLLGGCCAIALVITGCSSTGYSKGGDTSKGMEKTSTEVEAIVTQTDLTLTSLSNLVHHPAPDLVPQYKEFQAATKKLSALSDSVDEKAAEMKERADAYFADWDKGMTNITNPELRKTSEQRRTEVSSAFEEVAQSLKKSKSAFDPFLSDLKDIQQVLNLDLTQGGLKSISQTTKSALAHGADLRTALSEAAQDIRDLAVKMSSKGPAPKTEPQS